MPFLAHKYHQSGEPGQNHVPRSIAVRLAMRHRHHRRHFISDEKSTVITIGAAAENREAHTHNGMDEKGRHQFEGAVYHMISFWKSIM